MPYGQARKSVENKKNTLPIYGIKHALVLFFLCFTSLFAADDSLTYETLKKLIQENQITKIEDLLPLLPEDYRGSFVLMRKSESLQGASDENPRVILFGKDAKFVMAFNGDSSQKGFNDLEIMQFRDSTKTFDFKRVRFSSPHSSRPVFDEDGRACVGCHRKDSRPNWEASFWPGAYGATEDSVAVGTKEDKALQSFASKFTTHPRYKYLIPETRNFKHTNPEFLTGERYALATFPNFRFSFMVTRLNFERIAQLLKDSPDFKFYQFAIYGALFKCENIEEFIPSAIVSTFEKTPEQFNELTEKEAGENLKANLAKDPYATPYIDKKGSHPENYNQTLTSKDMAANMRYLMENRGISMVDWSMGLEPNSVMFSDGEHYFRDVANGFSQELAAIPGIKYDYTGTEISEKYMGSRAKDFKGTTRIGGNYGSVEGMENCRILKRESLKSLNKMIADKNGLPAHHSSNKSHY